MRAGGRDSSTQLADIIERRTLRVYKNRRIRQIG